jgi:hypothetical protein
MTVKATKTSLPEPTQRLVKIAEARRANELYRLTQRHEAAKNSFRLTSDRLRGNATDSAAIERILGPQRQALDEVGRTIADLNDLNSRDLVLRFVPEADEATWHAPQRPRF